MTSPLAFALTYCTCSTTGICFLVQLEKLAWQHAICTAENVTRIPARQSFTHGYWLVALVAVVATTVAVQARHRITHAAFASANRLRSSFVRWLDSD